MGLCLYIVCVHQCVYGGSVCVCVCINVWCVCINVRVSMYGVQGRNFVFKGGGGHIWGRGQWCVF